MELRLIHSHIESVVNNMSINLDSTDNLLIRPMTVVDYEQVNHFLTDNFYRDGPISGHCGEDLQKVYAQQIDEYHIAMIEEGLSLMVLEQKNNSERIVAVVLAGVQYPDIIDKNYKMALDMPECVLKHITLLTCEAERKANVFERFNVPKCLNFHMYAVDGSMRGKGVGARLVAAQLELCRVNKYPLMIAYCSSYYSARQMEKMGMDCVCAVAYTDYKDANGEQMFKPPAPHTHLKVMAVKL